MDEVIQSLTLGMVQGFNVVGFILIIITKLFSSDKVQWAGVGCVLIIIAIGNVLIFSNANLDASTNIYTLFSSVVFGSLGVSLLNNWLTLEPQSDHEKNLALQLAANEKLLSDVKEMRTRINILNSQNEKYRSQIENHKDLLENPEEKVLEVENVES